MAHPLLTRRRGQVLVFFALALPLVLLPIAAFAVDAALTTSTFSRLLEVTARAAEEAAQQINVTGLRTGGGLTLDLDAATLLARDVVAAAEPQAHVDAVVVIAREVRVLTTETVVLPFDFVGPPGVALHATAAARLAAGYDRPSSLLPLPVRTF